MAKYKINILKNNHIPLYEQQNIKQSEFEQLHYNFFFFSLLLLPWCQPLLPDPDLFACPESNMVNRILFPTGLIK